MTINNHVKNQYNYLAISDELARIDPFFLKIIVQRLSVGLGIL